jgi:hypothetical protein
LEGRPTVGCGEVALEVRCPAFIAPAAVDGDVRARPCPARQKRGRG